VGEHRAVEVTGLLKLLVTEGHLTELTLAQFVAKVDSDVTLRIALLCKLFGTVGTQVSWSYGPR
jgi:hypothetical protein